MLPLSCGMQVAGLSLLLTNMDCILKAGVCWSSGREFNLLTDTRSKRGTALEPNVTEHTGSPGCTTATCPGVQVHRHTHIHQVSRPPRPGLVIINV